MLGMTKEKATVVLRVIIELKAVFNAMVEPTANVVKTLWPATTLYATVTLSFVIPSEAEGSAVQRTFRGNVF